MAKSFKRGFTLLELIVSMAASSLIIGGFFVAFSSMEKTTRVIDMETKAVARANHARLMIHKILAGATWVGFKELAIGPKNYSVLYYYKWKPNAAGVEKLVEYGYFFSDRPNSGESSFIARMSDGGADYSATDLNLYFNRYTGDDLGAQILPEDFNYNDPNRFVVMEEITNFYATVEFADTTTGTSDASEKFQRYSVDYQITSAYDTGVTVEEGGTTKREKRSTIFKGNSYSLGRVTEG